MKNKICNRRSKHMNNTLISAAISKNLYSYRIRNRLTQMEMSQKLHISQSTYSDYENGKLTNIDVISDIEKILEMSLYERINEKHDKSLKKLLIC